MKVSFQVLPSSPFINHFTISGTDKKGKAIPVTGRGGP
jgi:hypothetical protein